MSNKIFLVVKVIERADGSTGYMPLHQGDDKLMITTDKRLAITDAQVFNHRFQPLHSYKVLELEIPDDGGYATVSIN